MALQFRNRHGVMFKGWVLAVVFVALGCSRKDSEMGSQNTDEVQPLVPAVVNAKTTKAVVYSAVPTVGNPSARKDAELQGYGLLALARGARFQVESGIVTISSAVEDCDVKVSAISGQNEYCVLKLVMECREAALPKSKSGSSVNTTKLSITTELPKVTLENLEKAIVAISSDDTQGAASIFLEPSPSDSQVSTRFNGGGALFKTKKSGIVSLKLELINDRSPPQCQLDLNVDYDVK